MGNATLYTIGHGNRTAAAFVALLKEYSIEYLIDVRSKPYSKFNPHFNQEELQYALKSNGITYVFMGDVLGGRPDDKSCYDQEGKVDYNAVKTKPFFKNGIERVKTAYLKNIPAALMCSESNPADCHRTKLIGRVLLESNILLQHIDDQGKLKDQITVINQANKGLSEFGDLFGNLTNSSSRKAYL